MGVAVYEQAPDAETLLLNDNAPAASSDDEVEEEAEVALSTVDSEFGRTTDPVGCTCVKWARSSCSRAKAKSRSRSGSRTACVTW